MAKEIKGEIKFSIQLNEEQKEGKRIILENEIIVITGLAGTGKSMLCAQSCLDLLFRGLLEKVFISRPAVETGKTLGYLKGSLEDKYLPYTSAFMDNLNACYQHRTKIQSMIEEGRFELAPIQFIRGKTIREKELIIVEEVQSCTAKEVEAILTRLGKGGKIILNGDLKQKDGNFDGLDFALELSKNINGVKHIDLKENHRSGLVGEILNYIYR